MKPKKTILVVDDDEGMRDTLSATSLRVPSDADPDT